MTIDFCSRRSVVSCSVADCRSRGIHDQTHVVAVILCCRGRRCTSSTRSAASDKPVRVRVQTELGDIVVEVDTARAPVTAANFLKYVDAGHYDGGTWHRTVKMDNQPESTIKIEVIQAGVNPDKAKAGFPPIALERTNKTGHPAQGRRRSRWPAACPTARRPGGSSASTISRRSISAACAIPTARDSPRSAAWSSRHGRRAQDSDGAVIRGSEDQHRSAAADAADQDR